MSYVVSLTLEASSFSELVSGLIFFWDSEFYETGKIKVTENEDRYTGATVHKVSAEVDGGDIVVQRKVLVVPTDTVLIATSTM